MVEKFRVDNYILHHLNYAIHPLGPPSGTLRRCRKSRDFSRPDPPQLFFTCHCFLCLTQTRFLNRSTQYHPSKPSLPDSPISSTSQLNCPPPRQIIHHINLTPIVEPMNARLYWYPYFQKFKIEKQVVKLLHSSMIRISCSPLS